MTPKEQAKLLRSQGKSLNEICKTLQVGKTTVWGWIRSVPLTEEQQAAIKRFGGNGSKALSQRAATEAMSKKYALLKDEAIKAGRKRIGQYAVVPELLLAGCMLYWAEGNKRDFAFSNSDPVMIKLFLGFIVQHMGVELDKVKVGLNFYDNVHTVQQVEEFWLSLLGVNRNCLYKSQINKRPQEKAGSKVGKLPYGVCSLTVTCRYKRYEIQGMIEAISKRLGA